MELTDDMRETLAEAQQECDANDKSTEYMIAYMQDMLNMLHSVDYDDTFDLVLEYLDEKSE